MKKYLLSLAATLVVTIPACDKQTKGHLDQMLLQTKALEAQVQATSSEAESQAKSLQAESKRLADQVARLEAGQEALKKELASTRAALNLAIDKASNNLATADAKAALQQNKLEQQLNSIRTILDESKPTQAKPPEPMASTSAGRSVKKSSSSSDGKPPVPFFRTDSKIIDSSSSSLDPQYAKSFVSPLNAIHFRFDPRTETWKSLRGAFLSGGDREAFVRRMEAVLKSSGKIPKSSSIVVQADGSIIIYPDSNGADGSPNGPAAKAADPLRVPDPPVLETTPAAPAAQNPVGSDPPKPQ